jgi:hypothetical protein
VMRSALECCHKGWGEHHHWRGRCRSGDQNASVPAGDGAYGVVRRSVA